MSSTGRDGADLLVGWGCVENSAFVFMMDCAKVGLVVWRGGRVEVPLHEVRTCVFDGLTKYPRDAPMFLSVFHRKGRSERYPQRLIVLLLVHVGVSRLVRGVMQQ